VTQALNATGIKQNTPVSVYPCNMGISSVESGA